MNIYSAASISVRLFCCFMLSSLQFQKGIMEAGSRLTKRWIKVCADALFGRSLCCPPPLFLLLSSLYMPRTSQLLASSTLFLFTDFVYSGATYLTFQFSPCLSTGIALTLVKTFFSPAAVENCDCLNRQKCPLEVSCSFIFFKKKCHFSFHS